MAFKKGQVGSTLTWFAAFLIVFFVLVLFLIFSSLLASKKTIYDFAGSEKGFSEVKGSSLENADNLYIRDKLFYLLNYQTEDGRRFSDYFFSEDDSFLREKSKEILNGIVEQGECYAFWKGQNGEDFFASNGLSSRDIFSDSLRDYVELQIFENNQKINIGIYFEKC